MGHFKHPQIKPSLILNVPSNIVQFRCGFHQSLFLDSEGNGNSVGGNERGQLGLGHNTKKNVLSKIFNIPPIKSISCIGGSCYLIDFQGYLWTFGNNNFGQLGHGNKTNMNTPKVVNTLIDIQKISNGSNGRHFLAKNSQNQIYVSGNNYYGQLGTGDTIPISTPRENLLYSNIWGDELYTRAKSARK